MIKVGITGSMGSGKTFISKKFESEFNIPLLLMDDVAKSIQASNKELLAKLVKRFPEGYPNNNLDRIKMREILFEDKSGVNQKDMSEIISPYILKEIQSFYEFNKHRDYVLVESALLFEYKLESLFDIIIFVNSDPVLRKSKALKRDNITSEEYDNRMKKQLPDEYKLEHSDYTIVNSYNDDVINEINRFNTSMLNAIQNIQN